MRLNKFKRPEEYRNVLNERERVAKDSVENIDLVILKMEKVTLGPYEMIKDNIYTTSNVVTKRSAEMLGFTVEIYKWREK